MLDSQDLNQSNKIVSNARQNCSTVRSDLGRSGAEDSSTSVVQRQKNA